MCMTAAISSAFLATRAPGIVVRDLLIHGMIAGAVAGLLAFGVAKVFGEPQIESAIAFEEQHAQGETSQQNHAQATADPGEIASAHQHGDEELVSRKVQSTAGLLTAVLVYGAAMGGLFALAFAFLYGRVGNLSPRLLALLLAAAGFAALYFVPSLKYPASPPAVGNGATIGYRTGLFFLMLLISLGALTFAVATGRRLIERLGALNGTLAAVSLFISIIVIAELVLPDINEVPPDFPAQVLWKFRMSSFAMQALMWATLGPLFGALAERVLTAPSQRSAKNSARA
jgi:predicted cobalt transporter CbtA